MQAAITFTIDRDDAYGIQPDRLLELLQLLPTDHLPSVMLTALHGGRMPRPEEIEAMSEEDRATLRGIRAVRIMKTGRGFTSGQAADGMEFVDGLLRSFGVRIEHLWSQAGNSTEFSMAEAVTQNRDACTRLFANWKSEMIGAMWGARVDLIREEMHPAQDGLGGPH